MGILAGNGLKANCFPHLGHSKSTYAPRGGGGTLKTYENVQGEGGRGKTYVRYKKNC